MAEYDFKVIGRSFFGADAFTDAIRQANNIAGGRPYSGYIANLPINGTGPMGDIEMPVQGGQSICVLHCTYESPQEG